MRVPGRIQKQFVERIANKNRAFFNNNRNAIIKHLSDNSMGSTPSAITLIYFSGKKYIDDQLYSMGSFYKNVGIPTQCIIISDGSYDAEDITLLQQIPSVEVIDWLAAGGQCDDLLRNYIDRVNVVGKRLHACSKLSIKHTTIITDTDILFFPEMKSMLSPLSDNRYNWFLHDHGPDYMEPYYWKTIGKNLVDYLNAGFLVLNSTPDWNVAIDYITKRESFEDWCYLTEQVAVQMMYESLSNIRALNPKFFIFDNKDTHLLENQINYQQIAMRHFAGRPSRNKMWQLDWKSILRF